MKRIDMRFIRPGASRANSHWACAIRGFTSSALFFSMARRVSRANRSASYGLAALGLQEVVAADEPAHRALVEDRRFDRGGAHDQHADAAGRRLGSQGQRQADDRMLGHHVAGDLAGRVSPAIDAVLTM